MVEDVLQALSAIDEVVEGITVKRDQEQEAFFEGPFKETISDMTSEELSKFFEFCTGYNYVPHDHRYQIQVEFSLVNDDSLPQVHTCEKILALPRRVYNGDKQLFKKKLEEAMSYTGRLMTMN